MSLTLKPKLLILDEPTQGLSEAATVHFCNLVREVARQTTILLIEHNMDVIKCADWVIDLGPEGGEKGGDIIAEGTPEDLAGKFTDKSYTAQFLKEELNRNK